jgi:hypothetical protein
VVVANLENVLEVNGGGTVSLNTDAYVVLREFT